MPLIMRRCRKFSQGGGGGGGVQIPRRGLTENFNMAKINNLAIQGSRGGGGRVGGSGPPVPPLDPPMANTLHQRIFPREAIPSHYFALREDSPRVLAWETQG